MPIEFFPQDDISPISFEEFHDELSRTRINPRNYNELLSLAPLLARLSQNKDFLVKEAVSQILNARQGGLLNPYGPQVILLGNPSLGSDLLVRACIWPSLTDQAMRVTSARDFTYFIPHDHNFNFITAGYLGDGYSSQYYEYDKNTILGYEGEEVVLRYIGLDKLTRGRIFLYRASVDVHEQIPPEKFSISLNIMESTERSRYTSQFTFNTHGHCIDKILSQDAFEAIFSIAAHLGGSDTRGLLLDIMKKNQSNVLKSLSLNLLLRSALSEDEKEWLLSQAGRI